MESGQEGGFHAFLILTSQFTPQSCSNPILAESLSYLTLQYFTCWSCLPEILFPTNYHNTLVPTPASLAFTFPISFVKSSSSPHPSHHFSLDFVLGPFLFSIYNNYRLSATISQASLLLLQPDISIWISHELIKSAWPKLTLSYLPPNLLLLLLQVQALDTADITAHPSCSSHQLEYHPSLVLTPASSHPVLSILPPERKWSRLVVPDSLWPQRLQPTRLLYPWDFLGKNTGVGCHFLLQIFLTQGLNQGLLHCRQTFYHLSHQGSPPGSLPNPSSCQPLHYHCLGSGSVSLF